MQRDNRENIPEKPARRRFAIPITSDLKTGNRLTTTYVKQERAADQDAERRQTSIAPVHGGKGCCWLAPR